MNPPNKVKVLYKMAQDGMIDANSAVLQDRVGEREKQQDALKYADKALNHNPFILTLNDEKYDFAVKMAEQEGVSLEAFVGNIFDEAIEDIRANAPDMYTVLGTSINHPGGFTRITDADSAEDAKKQFEENANVIGVFKGAHRNLLAKKEVSS